MPAPYHATPDWIQPAAAGDPALARLVVGIGRGRSGGDEGETGRSAQGHRRGAAGVADAVEQAPLEDASEVLTTLWRHVEGVVAGGGAEAVVLPGGAASAWLVATPAVEQLMPAADLRVCRVLHLDPRGGRPPGRSVLGSICRRSPRSPGAPTARGATARSTTRRRGTCTRAARRSMETTACGSGATSASRCSDGRRRRSGSAPRTGSVRSRRRADVALLPRRHRRGRSSVSHHRAVRNRR
jgi:hypothetical protein